MKIPTLRRNNLTITNFMRCCLGTCDSSHRPCSLDQNSFDFQTPKYFRLYDTLFPHFPETLYITTSTFSIRFHSMPRPTHSGNWLCEGFPGFYFRMKDRTSRVWHHTFALVDEMIARGPRTKAHALALFSDCCCFCIIFGENGMDEEKCFVYDRDYGGSERLLPKQGREMHMHAQRASWHVNE